MGEWKGGGLYRGKRTIVGFFGKNIGITKGRGEGGGCHGNWKKGLRRVGRRFTLKHECATAKGGEESRHERGKGFFSHKKVLLKKAVGGEGDSIAICRGKKTLC